MNKIKKIQIPLVNAGKELSLLLCKNDEGNEVLVFSPTRIEIPEEERDQYELKVIKFCDAYFLISLS